ncbi:MAG: hypothetical protein ACUVSQ_08070, partial [Pseudanabaenaceae cyanobacterium]
MAAGVGGGLWFLGLAKPIGMEKAEVDPTVKVLTGHTAAVVDVRFGGDPESLLSAGDDRTLRLWNWPSGQQRAMVTDGHSEPLLSLAANAQGTVVLTSSKDKSVAIWNRQGNTLTLQRRLAGYRDFVERVVLCLDERTAATASYDRTVR